MSRAAIPHRPALSWLLALLLTATLAACGGERDTAPSVETATATDSETAVGQAPKVVELSLGSSVGSDNRVVTPTTTFGANDTIYAAVTTEGGSGTVDLTAHWTYQKDQVVETQELGIPAGRQTTALHVQKPDGWPVGEYEVQILLDGEPAETRSFSVR